MNQEKLRQAKEKIGNTFALTVLLQKRCQELVRGAEKLVSCDYPSLQEIALEEILAGKIWLSTDADLELAEEMEVVDDEVDEDPEAERLRRPQARSSW